jgi:CTP:molybdopterin cytidylyltransferase MocA
VAALGPAGPPEVAVLAVDMPLLTRRTLARLRGAARGRDGAFLLGPDGRRQLAGVLARDRLAGVLPGADEAHGMAVHRLLARLDLAEVAAEGAEAHDVDTWDDLRRLRSGGGGGVTDT